MDSTSLSLLDQLQNDSDSQAWRRWLAIYEPWLRGWLRRHQLQSADVDDLLQNILTVVTRRLPDFVHNGRAGAFRAWLRTILVNQIREFLRARRRQPLAGEGLPDWVEQMEDSASSLCREWEREHDQQVVRRLLAAIQPEFQARTWEVFRLLVLEDRPADEVARLCRMERNAVYVAKSRVLTRLRQQLRGLAGE